MTEKSTLQWIKDNLSSDINKALSAQSTIYTEDWLAAMAYRETGIKIMQYIGKGYTTDVIKATMRGDYGKRPKDKEAIYHGYSFWQIDIDSYPDFVKSGAWKDAYKSCLKAISVLEEKRKYLTSKFPNLSGIELENAITAAYNTGQGNVAKSIEKKRDVDYTTFNQDYSKEVRRVRGIYKSL